jgi:hypothetical protein
MKIKNFTLLVLFSLCVMANAFAASITFTGGGDGFSWDDPANWDSGSVPLYTDDVFVGGFSVIMLDVDAYANTLTMEDNSMIIIANSGKLAVNVIDDVLGTDGTIQLFDEAKIINNGAVTNVNEGNCDAIRLHDQSSFVNNQTILVQNVGCDGIELVDESTFENNGTITVIQTVNEGLDVDDDAVFTNNGSVSLREIGEEGIDLDTDGTFLNYGSIEMDEIGSDGIDQSGSGSLFENHATITMSNIDLDGLEVDDGVFENKDNAFINISNTSSEGVLLESGGDLFNLGTINIENAGAEGIDVSSSSSFLGNENIINITMDASSSNEAIENGGEIYNDVCGVINILSDHQITNEVEHLITNDGVIATNFTGTNTNEGDIVNNGAINAPAGFTAAPNAVSGAGAVVAGPVPAQSDCNIVLGAFNCSGATTIDQATGVWTQTADDCVPSVPYTSDNLSFALQQLCGDGSITAKVESVTPLGWAGITFRESVDPDSKKVQLMANASQLLRREVRSTTGGMATPTQFPAYNMDWIRIERQGDYFRGYISPNGTNWFFLFNVYLPMDECAFVGVVTNNYNVNLPATSTFTNVVIEPSVLGLETEETPAAEEVLNPTVQTADLTANVYPNPTTGLVNVELKSVEEVVDLRVFNSVGTLIQSMRMDPTQGTSQEVNLTGMPAGMYFFHLVGENGTKRVERVILK